MKEFRELVEIMATLRGPAGCPWDREQEPEDLKPCVLEETYEVLDAIDRRDPDGLREELGDLLLQVVFLAQVARERGQFSIQDVVESIREKIVRRHPHVFGGQRMETAEEVLHQWERIKSRERHAAGTFLLQGTPDSLPALLKAWRLAAKAARVGFDWESAEGAMGKVEEELGELREAASLPAGAGPIRHEVGDLLFAVANLARHLRVDAESALQEANRRFTDRFTHMEQALQRAGRRFEDLGPEERDALWEAAKAEAGRAGPERPAPADDQK